MKKRTYRISLKDFEKRHGFRTTKEFVIHDLPEKKVRRFNDIRTGSNYIVDVSDE